MWKILLVLSAIIISAGLLYYYRDDVKNCFSGIKKWFKRNKKSITSVGTIGVLLGAGGGGMMLDIMPEAYIPTEAIEDMVGAMTTGNTETHIAVTYQDGDGTIDYVVSDDWWDNVADIPADSIAEVKLVIDNAPVDEYVLTWEDDTGEMHWQVETGGADGYFLNGTIQNSNGNSWAATGANIQLAIDDLSFGTVWLPSGTIILTDTTKDLQIPSGVHIVGAGMNSTTIKIEAGSDFDADSVFDAVNVNNISIRDLTIDCNGDAITDQGSGIKFRNCDDVLISNVEVRNARATGFSTRPEGSNFGNRAIINNCKAVSNALHAFSFGGDNITATNCIAEGHSAGHGLDSANCRNSVFSDFVITGCTDGVKTDGTTRDQYNCVFRNFVMRDLDQSGNSAGLSTTARSYDCSFSGFIIDTAEMGIRATNTAWDCQFSDFRIENCADYAISVVGNGYSFSNIYINNTIPELNAAVLVSEVDGVDFDIITIENTDTVPAILLYKSDNINIRNSKIINNDASGISFKDADNVTISDCVIKDNGQWGIYIGAEDGVDCFDVLITDNRICYNGVAANHEGIGISADGHDRYWIMANQVWGNAGTFSIDDDGTGLIRVSDVNLAAWNMLDNGVG